MDKGEFKLLAASVGDIAPKDGLLLRDTMVPSLIVEIGKYISIVALVEY